MSFTGSSSPSITYKYSHIVPKRREKYCCFDIPCYFHKSLPHSPLDLPVLKGRYQHLAPTVCVTRKQPAMAPKRATSKAAASVDDAAKAALLAEKKGKALADSAP
jgi:hypothetical protein